MRKFKAKKVYGKSKIVTCSFCGKTATHKSEQGLEVCHAHVGKKLGEIKCTCGTWLEQRVSKFGPYFNCLNCGNLNYNKAMEINALTMKDIPKVEVQEGKKETRFKKEFRKQPKEITITANDVDYFD